MLRKSQNFLQNFKNLTLGANSTTPKTFVKLYEISLLSQNNASLRCYESQKIFCRISKI